MNTKSRILQGAIVLLLAVAMVASVAIVSVSANYIENKHLHSVGPCINPLDPVENPEGTDWHELYPQFCNEYVLTTWIDGQSDGEDGYGVLSPCDSIHLDDGWYHVDDMTVTILLDEGKYLEFATGDPVYPHIWNAMHNPVDSFWHEVYPAFCNEYQLDYWEDNGDDVLSYCDNIGLTNTETEWFGEYHIEEVCLDLIISPEEPPEPSIDVNKWVWDEETGEWVEYLEVEHDGELRFKIEIHNDGAVPLDDIVVEDWLSYSLEYADDASMMLPDGSYADNPEPEIIDDEYPCETGYSWEINNWFENPLYHCETIIIEYDAVIVKTGWDYNWVDVYDDRVEVWDNDWVEIYHQEGTPGIDVEKWILDPETGVRVKDCTDYVGDTLTFEIDIQNDGDVWLSWLDVWDVLSDSLEYADNARLKASTMHLHSDYCFPPEEPLYEPGGTGWFEIYPQLFSWYSLVDWEDNDASQDLSPDDSVDLAMEYYDNGGGYSDDFTCNVDALAATMILWDMCGEFDMPLIVEFEGSYEDIGEAIANPVDTNWHEIIPEYCNDVHITDWMDNNEDGKLSGGDDIITEDGSWYYVDQVCLDIIVSPEDEWIPMEPEIWINEDGESELYWWFEGLAPGQTKTLSFDATVIEAGEDTNWVEACGGVEYYYGDSKSATLTTMTDTAVMNSKRTQKMMKPDWMTRPDKMKTAKSKKTNMNDAGMMQMYEDYVCDEDTVYINAYHLPKLCPDEYRWGDPAPGYSYANWPIFESWMDVHFINYGPGDAYNVTATISDVPANVVIVDGDVTVGDIAAGSGAWSSDSFTLQVDMNNPQDPNEGIEWMVEYDDVGGVHHVVESVPQFCMLD